MTRSRQESIARVPDLEAIYRSEYHGFIRVAAAVTGDVEAGVEAVQEAFASALAQLDTHRGEGPLKGWVWSIVLNAARASRRRASKRRTGEHAFVWELTAENGAGTELNGLRGALSALPERQRLVVFLRYYADLDYRTIGEIMGIETGTVSATLSAAHSALRRETEEVLK